jgi:hypothetical protein
MATCDIQTLVNQATCLGCLPVGQLQAIKTDLLCNYLVNPPNPPCTNLIPDGAVYTDVYTLNLVVGASYTITFGANETGLYNGAAEILNPHTSTPVTFIASGDGIFIIPSTNFSTVTAVVCGPACVNLIPAGAMYDSFGSYTLSGLTIGKTYQVTMAGTETSMTNGSQVLVTSGVFNCPAQGTSFLFNSFIKGVPVTAIICAI